MADKKEIDLLKASNEEAFAVAISEILPEVAQEIGTSVVSEAAGVLIGEHWSEKGVLWDGARKMVLTDRVGQSAVEGSIEIYKYQAAEDILRKVCMVI